MLLLRNGRMVKGRQFSEFRETGRPNSAVRIYSSQDADELVFLDIAGGYDDEDGVFSLAGIVESAAEECFMPLSAGGGIDSVQKVRQLIHAGADKVVITSSAVTAPELITEAAVEFGSQCVIGGIDYKADGASHRVWIKSGREETNISPLDHAKRLVDLGVGEIFLNSIDRDGMMEGYDLAMLERIASEVPVPVIACGGAGNFRHLAEAFENTKVSGAACASLFHFGDNNPIRARSYLRNQGIPMRILK